MMAVVRDITDRRLAEGRLRAAEEQFRRSFDDAPIGMMIVDLDERYIEVNDAFCAIVGRPRAALIGRLRRVDHASGRRRRRQGVDSPAPRRYRAVIYA